MGGEKIAEAQKASKINHARDDAKQSWKHFANCESAEASFDGCGQGGVARESVVDIGIFLSPVKASLASLSR